MTLLRRTVRARSNKAMESDNTGSPAVLGPIVFVKHALAPSASTPPSVAAHCRR